MKTLNIQRWHGADAIICAEHFAPKPYTLFFDSNRPSHPLNRWSFIAFDPNETIETKNGIITHNGSVIEETDFFNFLQRRLNKYDFGYDGHIPFIGGAAGYWGYDLGRQLEVIPNSTTDNLNAPDACIGIYTNVLAFDHINNEAWFIGETAPDIVESLSDNNYMPPSLMWQSNKTDEEYCGDIQKIIDYTYEGEIYQANLSRQFIADLPDNFDKFEHYKYLRKINSAPYSAYMNFSGMQLLSCSPEQFISVQENQVTTRPIKGTLSSKQNSSILVNNEKDRAENTMIVDLLRNDLSKTCESHSVTVPELCALETFEGLHHLVSTVKGVLQKDKTTIDVLRSCFPGGSITGAPKIRAQEIIEGIEETRRGPYCGSMGYIGFNGTMDTNIIIRTLIIKDKKSYLNLGSGIISDSTPDKELIETNDKGAKIFESFKGDKNDLL